MPGAVAAGRGVMAGARALPAGRVPVAALPAGPTGGIPHYTVRGFLPDGVHQTSWDTLVERYGWNEHRRGLLEALRSRLATVHLPGGTVLRVGGSFITTKERPGDIDWVLILPRIAGRELRAHGRDFVHGRELAGIPLHGFVAYADDAANLAQYRYVLSPAESGGFAGRRGRSHAARPTA